MPKRFTWFLAALASAATIGLSARCPAADGPQPLSAAEASGYLMWLHSLEQTRAGRVAAGQDESRPLYPFGLTPHDPTAAQPYRHLAISKAVTELEGRWNNRGEDRIHSPLLALSHARNYMHLSEYDSAQVWFALADRLDADAAFAREIAHESLATALADEDSAAIAVAVTNTLGADDLTGRESEVVLVFRRLLCERDADALGMLLQKVDRSTTVMDAEVRYWRAFALGWLGRHAEALDALRAMITAGGLSRGLDEDQRAWVLTALADLEVLTGSPDVARDLYRKLGESGVPELRAWGLYQQANLDFLQRNYARATTGFERACEADEGRPWRDHACAMQGIAAELARIRQEGERYGLSAYARP